VKEEENLQRVKTLDRQSRKSWGRREERRKTYMQYRERVRVALFYNISLYLPKILFSHLYKYYRKTPVYQNMFSG
jgi:hypothetical protein